MATATPQSFNIEPHEKVKKTFYWKLETGWNLSCTWIITYILFSLFVCVRNPRWPPLFDKFNIGLTIWENIIELFMSETTQPFESKLAGAFPEWSSAKCMFLMNFRNPKWLLPEDKVLTADHNWKYF